MDIPGDEEFSPLGELVSRFGLPNPLEFLPQLENRLEDVDLSKQEWDRIAREVGDLGRRLENEVRSTEWSGDGAEAAETEARNRSETMQRDGERVQQASDKADEAKIDAWDIIRWILILITIVASILAVTFMIAMGASVWTFGSSLLVWISQATGWALNTVTAVMFAIAMAAGLMQSILGEIEMLVSDGE